MFRQLPKRVVVLGAIVSVGEPMQDVSIRLANLPGSLAAVGEALAEAGISIEGGGAWSIDQHGVAHFLVNDGNAAQNVLLAYGIEVLTVQNTVTVRLIQDQPGQLGKLCRAMADARVNIEVLYSDHSGNLILVANDAHGAQMVAEAWTKEQAV
jgi:hypothetical protein